MAAQDIIQFVLVVSCMLSGWFWSSIILPFFGFNKQGTPKIETEMYQEPFMLKDLAGTQEQVYTDAYVTSGRLLLDQYGVFGVAPGFWSA
eukprot:CAMPEP_0194481468 /NCGR_PEP_ID=MMETSP0253-20130528/3878_1 /TAXON_ID=2966 /ORGANISM="Noctiluca scintillans" /LENGTH=89 /DNA_ID=CAMNT_0039320955 /DNA_START=94 /DNA_END=363 /DNA_ORIENTATION=-